MDGRPKIEKKKAANVLKFLWGSANSISIQKRVQALR